MLAGLRSRATAWSSRLRRSAPDGGFSLVEVMVAVALAGTVMASLGSFYVSSMVTASAQAGRQAAVQLANDGMERVRALSGAAILEGRDQASTMAQWAAAQSGTITGVVAHLTDMEAVYDATAAAGAGATAALPTSPRQVTVSNLPYAQHFFIGRCWQPAAGGTCGLARPTGAIEFRRVLVAVTWREKTCPNSACSYVAVTLVTPTPDDPIFNIRNSPPPVIDAPGTQYAYVGTPITPLQLTNIGGVAPFVWTVVSGLPAGLSLSTNGEFTGTPTTAATYTVTVRLSDGLNRTDTETFTWAVAHPPQLTDPANRTSQGGVPITPYTVPFVAGRTGHGPYTWSATGLPAGLSINATTGAITGTPRTVRTYQVTVTVTDRSGRTDTTAQFTWTIPPLVIATPPDQNGDNDVTMAPLQLPVSGGIQPYTWSAADLPQGLSINPAGVITGRPTQVRMHHVTLTARDADGTTVATQQFQWMVNN
jgi:prepilin-type N-terminal cleavage/methylation domain-containing protein